MKVGSLQSIGKMTSFGNLRAAFDHYARSTAARQTGRRRMSGHSIWRCGNRNDESLRCGWKPSGQIAYGLSHAA
jgi:hypothetical protein